MSFLYCRRILFFIPLFLYLFSCPSWGAASKKPPSLCSIQYPSDDSVEWECLRLRNNETLEGLFGDRWRDVARFNRVDRRHAYAGVSIKVPRVMEEIRDFTPMSLNYPPAEGEAKFILVDLSEQFLGAYEQGRLAFSTPIATGEAENETPTGEFRITAFHRHHQSSAYFIKDTDIPYPMNYALRFHVTPMGVSYWIHGRDLLGYPASHGCIGLYDEPMQQKYYYYPRTPVMEDARTLYEWVITPLPDNGRFRILKEGPRVLIVGEAPGVVNRASK